MRRFFALCLCVALSLMQALTVFATEPTYLELPADTLRLSYFTDVTYTQYITNSNLTEMKLDIFVPQTKEKVPCIVWIEGGGFIRQIPGNRIQTRMDLAKAGYVVASVRHQLVPNATFPQSVIDVKTAIRYLRAHADEYNIDTNRIGIIGCSAGGYMANMVGVTNGESQFDKGEYREYSSKVSCAVSLYGISDLKNIGEGLGEEIEKRHDSPASTESLLVNGVAMHSDGASVLETPEKTAAASPITYVDGSDVPFLLLHGDADTLVSYHQSVQMHEALETAGVPSKLYLLKGAGHGTNEFMHQDVLNILINFFNENLKK